MKKLLLISLIGLFFMSFTTDWNIPSKYKTMKNGVKSTTESVQIGKDLYMKNCKSCHGVKGLGDGPKSASLKTTMVSFTDKNYKSLKDGEKYYKSFVGKDEMPNFEKKIVNENDRWCIINYIETFK